jgi:hypothetical protein
VQEQAFICGVVGPGEAAKAAEHCELPLECDVQNLWCVPIASADRASVVSKAPSLHLRRENDFQSVTDNLKKVEPYPPIALGRSGSDYGLIR